MDRALLSAVGRFVQQPSVLVASDYDGTLAELTDDPSCAFPHSGSIEALRRLAGLQQTHVAVVSGRSLRELAILTRLPGDARLVGSHGAEFDDDPGPTGDGVRVARDRVADELRAIATLVAGSRVELKPVGAALHTRGLEQRRAREAHRMVVDRLSSIQGVHLRHGKDVVELSVVAGDKGSALDRLRRSSGVSAVCFVGDDLTDEDAFAVLHSNDLGVKVGAGATAAAWRVPSVDAVSHMLNAIVDARSARMDLRGVGVRPTHVRDNRLQRWTDVEPRDDLFGRVCGDRRIGFGADQ